MGMRGGRKRGDRAEQTGQGRERKWRKMALEWIKGSKRGNLERTSWQRGEKKKGVRRGAVR